jgi:hypothetical protein
MAWLDYLQPAKPISRNEWSFHLIVVVFLWQKTYGQTEVPIAGFQPILTHERSPVLSRLSFSPAAVNEFDNPMEASSLNLPAG